MEPAITREMNCNQLKSPMEIAFLIKKLILDSRFIQTGTDPLI